jgi:hypothetical protein
VSSVDARSSLEPLRRAEGVSPPCPDSRRASRACRASPCCRSTVACVQKASGAFSAFARRAGALCSPGRHLLEPRVLADSDEESESSEGSENIASSSRARSIPFLQIALGRVFGAIVRRSRTPLRFNSDLKTVSRHDAERRPLVAGGSRPLGDDASNQEALERRLGVRVPGHETARIAKWPANGGPRSPPWWRRS